MATNPSQPSGVAPGRLRNFVEMTIQTRQAQRLVSGRRGDEGKPPIIGLYRYGAMTRVLWSSAARDDPYADWYLLEIERTLTESKTIVEAMKQAIETEMARVSAMRVDLAQSMEPARIELTFSNPYGYMGAWLLADFDELVQATLTARHVGLLNRDDAERKLAEAGRAVRHAYATAQGFKATAVKRDDMRQQNRRAQRARDAMGNLPQAVLDGSLRADHAPATDGTADAGHGVASDSAPDKAEVGSPGAGHSAE